jgi:hypothetical protein
MSTTPPPQRDSKMMTLGIRLLGVAVVLAVIGGILALVLEGGSESGIGVVFILLAAVPGVAGIVLIGSAIVSRRSRAGKPFA